MTIDEVILNFRDGLLRIVPCFDRVGIPWKRPEAYDEWDSCATALFQALVVEPIRFTLSGAKREEFVLPDYDMLLPTYAGMSVIEVVSVDSDAALKVFHAFGTVSNPFDVVEVRAVNRDGSPQSSELQNLPLERARFAIQIL